jgi:hypothetical protein
MSLTHRFTHTVGAAVLLGALTIGAASAAGQGLPEPYVGRSLVDALRALQAQGLRIVFASNVVTPDLRVRTAWRHRETPPRRAARAARTSGSRRPRRNDSGRASKFSRGAVVSGAVVCRHDRDDRGADRSCMDRRTAGWRQRGGGRSHRRHSHRRERSIPRAIGGGWLEDHPRIGAGIHARHASHSSDERNNRDHHAESLAVEHPPRVRDGEWLGAVPSGSRDRVRDEPRSEPVGGTSGRARR